MISKPRQCGGPGPLGAVEAWKKIYLFYGALNYIRVRSIEWKSDWLYWVGRDWKVVVAYLEHKLFYNLSGGEEKIYEKLKLRREMSQSGFESVTSEFKPKTLLFELTFIIIIIKNRFSELCCSKLQYSGTLCTSLEHSPTFRIISVISKRSIYSPNYTASHPKRF